MKKIIPILIVIAAALAACALTTSGLLDRTSHTLDSASLFKAMDVMNNQTRTIDKLVNVLTIQNVVIGLVAVFVLVIAFMLIRAVKTADSTGPAWGRELRGLNQAGGLRFLSLDLPRARSAIHRLDAGKQQLLLNQLYVICSILESELGYGQQAERLPVVKQNDSIVHWG